MVNIIDPHARSSTHARTEHSYSNYNLVAVGIGPQTERLWALDEIDSRRRKQLRELNEIKTRNYGREYLHVIRYTGHRLDRTALCTIEKLFRFVRVDKNRW